jgi:hypothetical protein
MSGDFCVQPEDVPCCADKGPILVYSRCKKILKKTGGYTSSCDGTTFFISLLTGCVDTELVWELVLTWNHHHYESLRTCNSTHLDFNAANISVYSICISCNPFCSTVMHLSMIQD